MAFSSYAQNFEDVMLWRALGHVKNGNYIDVGALSPDFDSVTRAFYENGWSGINIEPNPKFLAQLKEKRPKDLNLGVAVSDESGNLTLHILDNPGLTTSQPDIARLHQESGMSAEVVEVKAQTLTEIWQEHVENGRDVHFLKVDVEGHEAAVIKGHDWSRFRPWVVVVEATFPNSRREVHDEWEPILLEADYLMVYRDGLNRFYVAKEHAELVEAFSMPPNVFDDFVLARFSEPLANLRAEFDKVSAALAEESSMRKASDERLSALTNELQIVQENFAKARKQADYFLNRSFARSLFFKPSGRPKKVFERLMFHRSGKPRGLFRKWTMDEAGK